MDNLKISNKRLRCLNILITRQTVLYLLNEQLHAAEAGQVLTLED